MNKLFDYLTYAPEPVPFEQLLQSSEPEQCLPVSVHDGDTMRVNVMFPFGNHKNKILVSITVRLLGYDCAEIVPKGPTRSAKDKNGHS
jgi:endonuclease YncB( thermonuclease family)